jgi:hypothetical protein
VDSLNFYNSESSLGQICLSVPRILSINNAKKLRIIQIIYWKISSFKHQTQLKSNIQARETRTINNFLAKCEKNWVGVTFLNFYVFPLLSDGLS